MNPKIIDYMVAVGATSALLTRNVAKLIEQGWQPWGSVSADHSADPDAGSVIRQAMVKYEPVVILNQPFKDT